MDYWAKPGLDRHQSQLMFPALDDSVGLVSSVEPVASGHAERQRAAMLETEARLVRLATALLPHESEPVDARSHGAIPSEGGLQVHIISPHNNFNRNYG